MFLPIGFGVVVDNITSGISFNKISFTILIILTAIVLRAVISYLGSYMYGYMNNAVLTCIKKDMFQHMLYLPVKYFYDEKEGVIMSRFLNDVNAIQSVTAGALLSIITDSILLITILMILIIKNWQLAIVAVLSVLGYIFVLTLSRGIRILSMANQENLADLSATLQESISGIKVTKAFVAEDEQFNKFNCKLQQWFNNMLGIIAKSSLSREVTGIITSMGPIFVLLYGVMQVETNSLSIGELVTFYTLLGQLYSPSRRLAQLNISMQTGLAAVNRIFDFLDVEPEPANNYLLVLPEQIKGKIKFENVSFSYQPDAQVLQNLTFEVNPGESVGIVGPSGVGKSTIAELLLGFYEHQEGIITIDGYDIRKVRISDLRNHIGFVSQDVFLFSGTILENIRYGFISASDEQVIEVAKAADAHDFICSLPHGYYTIVGNRGFKLSAGQRQRISIARALLKNPEILIFDEATSALDSSSQMIIQKTLNDFFKGRSRLIIAHRLSTVSNCDRIYVLNEGRVAESGTHIELLEKKSLYWELYSKEAGIA